MQKRFLYFILVVFIIIIGLLSRLKDIIPLWIGDALYAAMMFFITRFIFPNKTSRFIFIASLCFCFLIEFSQLYQADWINKLRVTWPGHMILGQGFLWSDLIAYILGVAVGLVIDKAIKKGKSWENT